MSETNPFTLHNYVGSEYFCDREIELQKLIYHFENQRYTTLVSNRKIGKTGLIYHLFHHIIAKYNDAICMYVDLYSTKNIDEFIKEFSTELTRKVEKKPNKVVNFVANIFKSIRPILSFDAQTGTPQLEFDFKNEAEKLTTLANIFEYLSNLDRKILIAFDEFQQIGFYPEQNIEAVLRTHIQKTRNVNFIFSGSHKHMLMQIFSSVQRPFYQSTDFLFLKTIPIDKYTPFIIEKMAKGKKQISEDAVAFIMEFTRVHTYYVQTICNKLFYMPTKQIGLEYVKEVVNEILFENEESFFDYRKLLPTNQWALLRGIAREQGATQLLSSTFMKKYNINTPGSVQNALKALEAKEMIFDDEEGKYYVQNVFLSRWLEKH